jgi:hypothetical protein
VAQMKFFIYSLSLALFIFILPGNAKNNSVRDSMYVQYLAGIYLIDNTTWITEKQKAQRYTELVQLTGITADSAAAFVSKYHNKPESWKKIQESIQNVYVEYENKMKNDTLSTTKSSERRK